MDQPNPDFSGVAQPVTPSGTSCGDTALARFRVMWPDSATVNKGRTSLDDIRNNPSHSEVPVFGFQTARHYVTTTTSRF